MATTNIQSFSGDVEVASNLTVDTTTLHVDSVSSRVGIGKTNPSVPCDISGDTKISSNLTVDTTTLHVDSVANRVGIGKTNPSVPCDISGDTKISSNLTVDTTTLHVDSVANRVGIGKTNPGYTMDVNGIVNATNLYIGGSALSSSPWTTVSNDISYGSGNVFIGENYRCGITFTRLTATKGAYTPIDTWPSNLKYLYRAYAITTSPNNTYDETRFSVNGQSISLYYRAQFGGYVGQLGNSGVSENYYQGQGATLGYQTNNRQIVMRYNDNSSSNTKVMDVWKIRSHSHF